MATESTSCYTSSSHQPTSQVAYGTRQDCCDYTLPLTPAAQAFQMGSDSSTSCRYEGAEFDSALVNFTYQLCLKCITDNGQASPEEVCEFVNTSVSPRAHEHLLTQLHAALLRLVSRVALSGTAQASQVARHCCTRQSQAQVLLCRTTCSEPTLSNWQLVLSGQAWCAMQWGHGCAGHS